MTNSPDYKLKFTFVLKIRFTVDRLARLLSIGFSMPSNSLIIFLSASFLFAMSECFMYSKSCRYKAPSTQLMGQDHNLGLLSDFSLISSLVPGPVKLWPGRSSSPGNFDNGSLMQAVCVFKRTGEITSFLHFDKFCLIRLAFRAFSFQHSSTMGSGYVSSIFGLRYLPTLHAITVIMLHLCRSTSDSQMTGICDMHLYSFLCIRIDFRPGICLSIADTARLLDMVVGPPEGSWMDCWLHLGKLLQQISKTRGTSVSIAWQTDWHFEDFWIGRDSVRWDWWFWRICFCQKHSES